MTMATMAAMVWFIPGWLRTAEPRKGVLESVSDAFPETGVEFNAKLNDWYNEESGEAARQSERRGARQDGVIYGKVIRGDDNGRLL